MADNLIRWKRSDYARLSKAVNKYNKQINELAKAGYEYLQYRQLQGGYRDCDVWQEV